MAFRAARYSEIVYALMRFLIGLNFAVHGAQKLFGFPTGHPITGKPLMMVAGAIEFFGGLLVAFGLLTRIAAVIAAGEMAVAYFMVHAPGGFWPLLNKGELAVAYCFVFLFIAVHGGGLYSLDHALSRRRRTVFAHA